MDSKAKGNDGLPPPQPLADMLVSLMPGTDNQQMWRGSLASALEQVAATDDLTLLRAAKGADEFEKDFMAFVSNFPGLEITPAPEGGFYGVALELARFDRDLRGEALRAYAAELRKI